MPTMWRIIVGAGDANVATDHIRNDNHHVQHYVNQKQIVVERTAGSGNIVEVSTPNVRIEGAETNDLTLNFYANQRKPVEGGTSATHSISTNDSALAESFVDIE